MILNNWIEQCIELNGHIVGKNKNVHEKAKPYLYGKYTEIIEFDGKFNINFDINSHNLHNLQNIQNAQKKNKRLEVLSRKQAISRKDEKSDIVLVNPNIKYESCMQACQLIYNIGKEKGSIYWIGGKNVKNTQKKCEHYIKKSLNILYTSVENKEKAKVLETYSVYLNNLSNKKKSVEQIKNVLNTASALVIISPEENIRWLNTAAQYKILTIGIILPVLNPDKLTIPVIGNVKSEQYVDWIINQLFNCYALGILTNS